MGKIHSMMDIGKRTMMNSQSALQTVAHNIANKTTEGYSRQRVDQTTAPPVADGRLQLGMGSRAAQVSRVNNPFLDKQLQMETGVMGFHDAQANTMGKVEQIFNEQSNKGLNQYMSDFFNAFRELSNNPESNTTRVVVREAASALANDFHRVDSQLERVQKEIDMEVRQNVGEINKMTSEVANLNQKIAEVEIQGVPANDARDRRDVLIKHLHEKIDIRVAEGDNGMLSISTAGNALLVSGLDSTTLTVQAHPVTKRDQIYYVPSTSAKPFDITDRIKGGHLGGDLDIRDKLVPDLKEQMNQLAEAFANEVNAAHVRGFDRSGRQGGLMFEFAGGDQGSAAGIKLNDNLSNDVSRIAAAGKPGAAGDNTVANVISMLQFKQNMDGATMDDFYTSQVGRVGVVANRAVKAQEAQKNILEQVNTLRESVSGVSLDEEATKMIEFQKAFDASARVIRTADEMFDTVLNLKRL
jgi:flagellar hook-associated protein 1 FlgK